MVRLCIPPSARFVGFSFNTLLMGLLIVLTLPEIIKKYKNRSFIQKRYIGNVGSYVGVILFLSLISSVTAVVPLPYQIAGFAKYCYTEFLPSVIIILLISQKDMIKCNYVIGASVIFATSYAIFTFFTQSNPLFEMFNTGEAVDSTADFSRRGGLLGTSVGITDNKINASLHSMLFFTYFWTKRNINQYMLYLILLLSMISGVLTSQRTCIINIAIFMACIFFSSGVSLKKILKIFIAVGTVAFIATIYFEQLDELKNMLQAAVFFWSDDVQEKLGVHGSSMDLRLRQFLAVLKVTNIHIIEGLGYDFNQFYEDTPLANSSIGDDLAGFESLIFTTIASSGLVGLVALFVMYLKHVRLLVSVSPRNNRIYSYAFVGTFLLAAIMTNYSGASYLFFAFLSLNIIYACNTRFCNSKIDVKNEKS